MFKHILSRQAEELADTRQLHGQAAARHHGEELRLLQELRGTTANFRGFDSNIILILKGGILMSIGDFPDI